MWVAGSALSLCSIHLFLMLSPHGAAPHHGIEVCGSLPRPLIAMIWLGLTYSACAASIWPLLSNIVPTKYLGTGYGLMTAIQNLGLAVFHPSLVIFSIAHPTRPSAARAWSSASSSWQGWHLCSRSSFYSSTAIIPMAIYSTRRPGRLGCDFSPKRNQWPHQC